MKFKRKIDYAAFKGAIRTAGALMVGNFFVAVFVFDKTAWIPLSVLLAVGVAAIILTSLEKE